MIKITYEVIQNESNWLTCILGGIGDWGQPGIAASGYAKFPPGGGAQSHVRVHSLRDNGAHCNTVANPRSHDAGSIQIWAELEEGESPNCEYVFAIQVKIEGETHGDTAGVSFSVKPLGGEPLLGSAKGDKQKFSKDDTLRAVACMKEGEKIQILDTSLSVVTMGKGHIANAWQEAEVTAIVNNGPCKEAQKK